MTTPVRTKQHRMTKLGAMRVSSGEVYLPEDVAVGIACGATAIIHATFAGQEVFSVAEGSKVFAEAPDTYAYATGDKTQATAVGKQAVAIAIHSNSKAYAKNKGAIAYATVAGARAYRLDVNCTVVTDVLQNIFPNNKRELEMLIT